MTDQPQEQHQHKKKLFYLAIDVEREGDALGSGVIAIGACFGPADGSWEIGNLLRFRGNMKLLPTDQPDPLCKSEFWDRYPEIFKNIKDNERDPKQVLTEFEQWCLKLVQTYEIEQGNKIELISDCPDGDLAQIDFVASQVKGGLSTPVRYLGGKKRHNCRDPGERFSVLGCHTDFELWLGKTFKSEHIVHDHQPENDARHNYYQMVYLNRFAKHYLVNNYA